MGKIFKVTGNYKQNGKWATPDPSFVGKIVVDNLGRFCGYCDELYESEQPEENKLRFIYGQFGKSLKNGKDAFVFYKLSNYEEQKPLLYEVIDKEDPSSWKWSALNMHWFSSTFSPQDGAKVDLEELEYSEEEAAAIRGRYGKIYIEDGINKLMLHLFDKFAKQRIDY